MIEDYEEIAIEENILFNKVYHSEKTLANHINRYLIDEFDSIAVFKFSEHLPDLLTVSQNLEVLNNLQEFSISLQDGDIKNIVPFRVIRILESDWIVEVCAVLGGLGGLATVIQLIRDIVKDGKITKVENVPQVRAVQSPNGYVQRQTVYVQQEVEKKYIDPQSRYTVVEVSNYYRKNLSEIQLYTRTGKFYRVKINQNDFR